MGLIAAIADLGKVSTPVCRRKSKTPHILDRIRQSAFPPRPIAARAQLGYSQAKSAEPKVWNAEDRRGRRAIFSNRRKVDGPSGRRTRAQFQPALAARRGSAMNGDPLSHGLWEETAPAAPPAPKLQVDFDCDVAIVGAGYTGLSAALHAAEGGATVAVLDGAEIGFGGSGRNVGLVNAGMWVMPDELPKTLGEHLWRAAADAARRRASRRVRARRQAPDRLRGRARRHAALCGRSRAGSPNSRSASGNGARVALRCACSTRPRRRRRSERTRYAGALLDERAGTIQPLAYARGLAGAAHRGRRPYLFRSARSLGCHADGDRWILRTPHGRGAGEMGYRRHQRLHGRAVGRVARRADPSALFQRRHGSARRGVAARDPARATRLLGHPPGSELVSLRPGRPAGVRQRRRAARDRPADPPRLGPSRACQAVPAPRWRSSSSASGTA